MARGWRSARQKKTPRLRSGAARLGGKTAAGETHKNKGTRRPLSSFQIFSISSMWRWVETMQSSRLILRMFIDRIPEKEEVPK